MKRIVLLIGILLLSVSTNAEKIRVWYMPNGQIRHTVFGKNVDRDREIERILQNHPELRNADYEDIEREDMPDWQVEIDPDVKNRQRETWERKTGGGIVINQEKVKEIKQEKAIAKRILEIRKKNERDQAIKELKNEGKLPADF